MIKKSCMSCIHCNLKKEECDEGHWDRNDSEETWLHSNNDFNEYINKDRICSDFYLIEIETK